MEQNGSEVLRFDTATTPVKMGAALKHLNGQIAQAKNAGLLDEKKATDAQYHIAQVITQTSRPTMNRQFVLKHLTEAVSCLAAVSALGLVLQSALPNLLKLIG
jgi:hypothetical protein